MELSYTCKMEAQEIIMSQEGVEEDEIKEQLEILRKEMDEKRKNGLK